MRSQPYLQRFIDFVTKNQLAVHHLRLLQGDDLIDSWDSKPVAPLDQRSITKSVVALAFGCMREEYQLNTTDPVLDYFPDLAAAWLDSPWRDVTLEHLLTMSHGQPGKRLMARFRAANDNKDWLPLCFEDEFISPPGRVFRYSNTGPYLLGIILSSLIQEPLEDYIQRHVLGPLGISKPAYLFDPKGRFFSGSGMQFTIDDLVKLARAIARGSTASGAPWVPVDWLKQVTAPAIETGFNEPERSHYGYYFWLARKNSWYMSGANSQIALYTPEKDLLFCCNGRVPDSARINTAYWDLVFPAVP
ncbi:MAG TPA: serine hydrolase [Clostridiaceae bacterium]|nr:serine hydrolase [Clostridiaceae bacterium]